jgi:hypothetical protein
MYRYINTTTFLQDYEGLTNRERIEIVLEFYHSRGVNKENVNELYRKILKQ